MAQSAVTVRMDSEMKTQFDALCEQFGMSANTAFNIFVKAVIRSRSIPFTIKGTPSALDLFMQQRSAAELSKEPELSLDERRFVRQGKTFVKGRVRRYDLRSY